MRLVIIDDHQMVLDGLKAMLRPYAGQVEIVGECSEPADAVRTVEKQAPDAVLLDVRLGDDDGFALACVLRRRHPDLGIVLVSSDVDRLPTSPYAHGPVEKDALARLDLAALLAPPR